MTAPDFSHLRQRMMAEIAVKTIYRSAQLGKAALHRRVMDESMGSRFNGDSTGSGLAMMQLLDCKT